MSNVRNYWVCDACLPLLVGELRKRGEVPRLRTHPTSYGWCMFRLSMFCHVGGALPARKSIHLSVALVEGSRARTSAPQIREIKPLKPVETRVFEALAYFVGKNPLKRISERLFAQQRQGSMFIQMLTTRFTTMLEEDSTIVEEE